MGHNLTYSFTHRHIVYLEHFFLAVSMCNDIDILNESFSIFCRKKETALVCGRVYDNKSLSLDHWMLILCFQSKGQN